LPFDIISFLVGVAAGALTGSLAAVLHGLESIADMQERVRQIAKEAQKLNNSYRSQGTPEHDTISRLNELQHDLDEIHEEIRRMYRRTSH
jgi:septal ring factor EnvC (AmiA/AmiB activator)